MNRVKTELEERREKENREKERRRLLAWKDEKERKLRPGQVQRLQLEEESKKVRRKMRSVGRRLEEEQRVMEEMRAKEKEGKVVREREEEERKVQEMKTREARNKEWRMRKEGLKSSIEMRANPIVSGNEDIPSVEEALVGKRVYLEMLREAMLV